MLPKETVPEGSRKMINGKEVYTLHYFTMEEGNCFETVSGDFIFPNGEPVNNRSLLEALPEQHRQRALAWWDNRKAEEVMDPPNEEDLMAENEALKSQIATLQAESNPVVQKPNVEDLVAENKILREQIAAMEQDTTSAGKGSSKKDLKEKKLPAGKMGTEKGPSVLKQMGIAG